MWKKLNVFYLIRYLLLISLLEQFIIVQCESGHRTKAASEKQSELYCYKCDTIENLEDCITVTENSTVEKEKCTKDYRICQVKTIVMSTPQENKTAPPKLWYLERSCAKVCEPVCVTIGERTKVRGCNTCCETNFCNTGNTAVSIHRTKFIQILLALFVAVVFTFSDITSQMRFVDDDSHNYAKKY